MPLVQSHGTADFAVGILAAVIIIIIYYNYHYNNNYNYCYYHYYKYYISLMNFASRSSSLLGCRIRSQRWKMDARLLR